MKIGYQIALGFIIVMLLQVVITAVGAWKTQGQTLAPITISQGVAVYPENGPTAQDVPRAMDEALYGATLNGRNHVALAEGAVPETENPS